MKRPRQIRYTDRKRNEERRGWVLIAISAAAVIIAGAFMILGAQPERDKVTGCPRRHTAPPAHTVILFDQTDPLSENDLTYASDLILNEYFWLPLNGRLTIRGIVEDPAEGKDSIVICRMIDPDDVKGIVMTKGKVEQDFERMAGARLREFLASMRSAKTQDWSPIAETAAALFERSDFGSDIATRRLVIISDMAQHSPAFSHYAPGAGGFAPPAAVLSQLKHDMSGYQVRVHYIRRPGLGFQGPEHIRFWKAYFAGMGAETAIGHALQIGEDPDRPVWHRNAG